MQFQTIPQANNRNTYQQVFNGHLTGAALQRFPLANIGNQVPMMPPYGHIQPHPYGQLGLLSNPPQAPQYRHQYGPRPRISHPYDNMSSAGYITPRFMTDRELHHTFLNEYLIACKILYNPYFIIMITSRLGRL